MDTPCLSFFRVLPSSQSNPEILVKSIIFVYYHHVRERGKLGFEDLVQRRVDRLFELLHASKLDQIETAARVLGCTVEVRVG